MIERLRSHLIWILRGITSQLSSLQLDENKKSHVHGNMHHVLYHAVKYLIEAKQHYPEMNMLEKQDYQSTYDFLKKNLERLKP